MHDSNHQKIDDFTRDLKQALGESNPNSAAIVDEVHGDLLQHIERHRRDGMPETEAVERALAEMGNPFELAHHIGRVVPPFGGKAITTVRYVLAAALILWTLVMLWHMRAGLYGFDPSLHAIVLFFHLPAILLLWPRIVWRRNYLFGLIPAGLAVIGALFLSFAGTRSEEQVVPFEQAENGELIASPGLTENANRPHGPSVPIAIGLSLFSLVLILAMQQRSQRRLALAAIFLTASLVEAAYQFEELRFRKERSEIDARLEAFLRTKGQGPTREELAGMGLNLEAFSTDGHRYSFFWPRPLSPGYALVGNSDDESIRVQD